MIGNVFSDRVRELGPANAIEQEHLLRELLQQYLLAGLSRARFFATAVFHGGTCLRILFGTGRFSEDLDFMLKIPEAEAEATFQWRPYVEGIRKDCAAEGLLLEVQERGKAGSTVRSVLVKAAPLGRSLTRALPFPRRSEQKIRVKLEIDTRPPAGSSYETRFITFPVTASITTQTLSSSFSNKAHALLCRPYVKGRDWYDFLWYVSRAVVPEPVLLSNALEQQGPWAGQAVQVTTGWFMEVLRRRIEEIDWDAARDDVQRFVPVRELESISLWERDLFLHQLERLREEISRNRMWTR